MTWECPLCKRRIKTTPNTYCVICPCGAEMVKRKDLKLATKSPTLIFKGEWNDKKNN